jgi:hypothetical protein
MLITKNLKRGLEEEAGLLKEVKLYDPNDTTSKTICLFYRSES